MTDAERIAKLEAELAACRALQGKRRSLPHHRRFFGLIDAAFQNWNHDHEFQPDDAKHLRAYLLCRAGYRQSREVPVAYSDGNPALAKLTAIAVEAALKEAGAYAFIRPHPDGGSIAVYRAKSIKWSELPQKDFAPLAEAVEQIIEAELGVDAETLLREQERAA